jgi:hypothetical protein
MASGSTYPPAPEYFRLCCKGEGLAPPQPVDGEYTVFGQTANSSVSIPKIQGKDMIQVDSDGSVGGLLPDCCEQNLHVGLSNESQFAHDKNEHI